MPLKLPKLPETRAVQLTATVVKYAVFVVALAAVGSFVPRFLRSKIRVPEENRYMRKAIGNRVIYELDRDARLTEGDARRPARESQVLRRGDVAVLWPDRRRRDILARVVGLPGDQLVISRVGRVTVNGRSEIEHYVGSYASSEGINTRGVIRHEYGELFVPRGYIYCLTDQRGEGVNRELGIVSLRKVRGKLVLGPRDRGRKE